MSSQEPPQYRDRQNEGQYIEPPIEGKPYNGDPAPIADPTMAGPPPADLPRDAFLSPGQTDPTVALDPTAGAPRYGADLPVGDAEPTVGALPYGAESPPGAQPYGSDSVQPYGLGQPPAGQPYYAEQGQPYPPAPQAYPPPGYPQGQYPPAQYPGQPPYPYPYPYAPPQPTNGMAIAAMVLGILWIYWIGSILALIFGYVARAEIKRSKQGGDGMAIAGIVLGWVGVGILCIVLIGVGIAASR